MNFEWSTFILEIINFLVLAWLLTHFFYRPVVNIIDARRAESTRIMEEAAAQRAAADACRQDYADRVNAWEEEKRATKAKLEQELAEERQARLATLEQELIDERARRVVLDEKLQAEKQVQLERQAATLANRFVARLMERLAGPELEARLADMAVSDLANAPPELAARLRSVLGDTAAPIRIQSAWHLDDARRGAFTANLSRLAGKPLQPEFIEEPALQAGVCVIAGEWVLAANLRDELSAFSAPIVAGASHEDKGT